MVKEIYLQPFDTVEETYSPLRDPAMVIGNEQEESDSVTAKPLFGCNQRIKDPKDSPKHKAMDY